MFDSIDSIKQAGFTGFHAVGELMTSNCENIPRQKGVYLVLNPTFKKSFLPKSDGGFFKRTDPRDPKVSISELEHNWVHDALVVYIGQSGGGKSKSDLRKRLRTYMKFGQGEFATHWGGRYIWQLEHNRELVVCYKTLSDADPKETESDLISSFKRKHNGKRPFANLQG